MAKVAEKAKAPAIAGGAVLVGLAGGLALNNRKSKGPLSRLPKPKLPKVSMPKLSMPDVNPPNPGEAVKALSGAAKQIADGSARVNQLASEVQKVSESISGEKK